MLIEPKLNLDETEYYCYNCGCELLADWDFGGVYDVKDERGSITTIYLCIECDENANEIIKEMQ